MAENRGYFSEIMNMGGDNEMETEEDDNEKMTLYKEPMRRNLLDVFDKVPVEVADERMSVFLRVRPFSSQELESGENQDCVDVQNSYMVSAHAPRDSHTFKAQLYGLNKARHNFTFSRVFPESTTQKEFFDSTMLKLVQDFIEGQNCLVFTYGVTNSGKTYTIQGNPRDAGVLPRGLDVLFNSISGKQWPGMDLKPGMFNDVVKLSPEDEEKERKIKERTLKLNCGEDHDVMTLLGDDASDQSVMNATGQSDSSTTEKKGSIENPEAMLAELENRDREETAVDVSVQGQIRFCVWVSFAEIYNEQIFDLLEPMPKKKDARRPVLKLSEDRRGSPYIKGLKEINVTSADEAYKLLTIGQRNLKTACTRLNHCSSRSHCIFNIKIIRVPDKGNPKMARVSMLSLCDLAGSERHSKTHTTGERLKEAGNINTSLLTLGRCIELLRYNQQHKDKEKIIPFRESRLTRLFQNFFCGRGKAAMIVNVSQCASMFDETLNVFKFSAIAKQVVMPPKPVEKAPEPRPKRSRTTKGSARASSICWETAATPSRQSHLTAEVVQEEEEDIDEESDGDSEYIEQLEQQVEMLENKVREMKGERLAREFEIRREVCLEMQEQFVQIEDMYSNLLKETRQQEEERYEKKLQLVMKYSVPEPTTKRPRLDETTSSSAAKQVIVDEDDEWVSSLLLHQEKVKVQEREASLAELRGQVTELEFKLADLSRKNKELTERTLAAEKAQEDMEPEGESSLAELKERMAELESQLTEVNSKNKELTERTMAGEKALKDMEKECAEKVALAESQRDAAFKEASKGSEDLGHTVLLETLGRQLQESKDRLKQQEKEIGDLNEMLQDAGDTFLQKEAEISKLTKAIEEYEESSRQQVETIRELRTLLEESKAAVEDSEKCLAAKNRSIGDMKEELNKLEVRLKGEHQVTNVPDSLKKCQEELAIARNRLKHEEEDFRQREKALIHGYTAEINNLKSQMALLKSRNLGKCVATSPMWTGTPEKARSPARTRRRKLGLGDGEKGKKRKVCGELDESMRMDLVCLLKDLGQDKGLSADLRQKLRDAQLTAESLQQQADSREEVEGRLQQSQQDLGELQSKFAELSAASSELQRQLDKKKELHTELTDNQSESAELRQKLRILESSVGDLEARLASASQKTLAAEASKAQVLIDLKDTRATLEQITAKKTECEAELADLHSALQSMTDSSSKLQEERDSYKMTLQAQHTKMEAAEEEKEQLQEDASQLKGELQQWKAKEEKAREKNEEMQTVVTELRSMLNQTAGDLATRSQELKNTAVVAEKSADVASSNEAMLKTALSEANDMMQEKTQQCEVLQQQLSECQASIAELQSQRDDAKTALEKKTAELSSHTQKLDSLMQETESLKTERLSALEDYQNSLQHMQSLQAEMAEKAAKFENLEAEITSLTESHLKELQELKEHNAEILSTIEKKHASESSQLKEQEEAVKELTLRAENVEKTLADRDREIAVLQQTIQAGKETESLLADITNSKEETEKRTLDLEKQLKEICEQKQASEDLASSLQAQVTATEENLQQAQQELDSLKTEKKTTEDALTEQKKLHSELQQELEAKNCVMDDLKEKEATRLLKLQSLEKAQKETKRLQEKKLIEAREALMGKEKEVEELKASFAQLQEETSQSGALVVQLSETNMEIAELRSKLHMEKAVTQKHKDGLEAVSEEKDQLEKRVDSITQELEKLQKEKANLMEEISLLRSRMSDQEQAHAEAVKKLSEEVSEHKATVDRLTSELQAVQQSKQQLQNTEETSKAEQSALQERLKEAQEGEERWREMHKQLQVKLDSTQRTLADTEQSRATLEQRSSGADFNSETKHKVEELTIELEAERSKGAEFHKQIKALSAIDTTSDAPGTSRRLRKEKIQAESDLACARFEVEKLQRHVEKLLNNKESAVASSSPFTCSSGLGNRGRSGLSEQSPKEATLHQDLREKTRLLQEAEAVRQRCECELLEVKAKLSNTETELKELQASQDEGKQLVRTEALQTTSVRSRSHQQDACDILHEELEKSQKREATLRQQLQDMEKCSSMVDKERVARLEQELAQKTAELQQALQREKELSKRQDESLSQSELQHQMETLRTQVQEKEQRLQDKKQAMADLQTELSRAQQQRKIAVNDMKANEQVIQQLKDAMLEQEETMEKQDTILNEKDNEIQKLTSEMECLTDRCQQLLKQEADTKRELHDLTRLQVRLEEDKKQLSTDYISALEDKAKLRTDLTSVQAEVAAATMRSQSAEGETVKELRETKRKLADIEQELAKVKKAYEKDTKIYLAKEDEANHLQKKVQTLEEEVTQLQEKCKKGETDLQEWREQRDKLVGQLDQVMNKQIEDNKQLKAQLAEEQDQYGKLLEQERREKQELKRQLKVLQRAKDSVVGDLRHSNHQLQVELAQAQGQDPPPEPPPPQHHSFRVNDSDLMDDIDTTGHLEVDATPPVAAKNLRKGRKRTSALDRSSSSTSSGSSKARRKPAKKDMGMEVVQEMPGSPVKETVLSHLQELEEKSTGSPLTRSAKKLLRWISPERTHKVGVQQENTPPPPPPAPEEPCSKRGRRKPKNEDVPPPPFDCAPYQPALTETRKSSRLRDRRQTSKQSDI